MTLDQHYAADSFEREAILEELLSRSCDYSWLWRELSSASNFVNSFATLRRQVDPERPYFSGSTSFGLKFVGDARDLPCALHVLKPDFNSLLMKGLVAAYQRRGDTGDVIDVGANIGVVAACLASNIQNRGLVHAFEPVPDTFKLAAATLALNRLDNVLLYRAAAGRSTGEEIFHAAPGNSAIGTFKKHSFTLLNEWADIPVPVIRLDQLEEDGRLRDLGLIKVDAEGQDLDVLKGAEGLIRKHLPTVVFEYTPALSSEHGWSDVDACAWMVGLMRCSLEAVAEPALLDGQGAFCEPATDGDAGVLPFPLPDGLDRQVNVFATPLSRRSLF
jgi:FkbM family methyltransferase